MEQPWYNHRCLHEFSSIKGIIIASDLATGKGLKKYRIRIRIEGI